MKQIVCLILVCSCVLVWCVLVRSTKLVRIAGAQ
jgi:hypothetical protein